MAGVNKVILLGFLGKDPEVRTLDNGVKVVSFSMATTESWKDKNTGERVDATEWHNVTLWNGLAEVAERFLTKGACVYIEGKIQTRSYEQDGVTKYATNIIGNSLNMIGGNNSGEQQSAPQAEANAQDDDGNDLPF